MGLAYITLKDRKYLQLSKTPSEDVRTTEEEEDTGVADHALRSASGLGFLARYTGGYDRIIVIKWTTGISEKLVNA